MEGADEPEVKQSIPNRIIATMSGVCAPIVYLLAAVGLIQGVLIIVSTLIPDAVNNGTYQINVISLQQWPAPLLC